MVKTGPVAPPVSLLMAVRAARHENYDRVVFEFAGQLPGYRVQYTQPPIQQDASGLPIKIAGNAFLTVRMEPAAVHDDSGKPTMALKELVLNLPSLLELTQTGDFDSRVGGFITHVNRRIVLDDEQFGRVARGQTDAIAEVPLTLIKNLN